MTNPHSAREWMDVLDEIKAALQRKLAATAEPTNSEAVLPDTRPLQQLEQRLAGWRERLNQIDEEARGAEEALAQQEVALREWQKQVVNTRELALRVFSRPIR